jgi:alpha-soluble NSF attachment protein
MANTSTGVMTSKGDELYKKAEGKITGWFGKDFEAGCELFNKAGAAYKVDKQWDKAGDAFMRAGDCAIKEKDTAGACQAYTESANAYKRYDINKARGALQAAINLNIENNRLSSAAKLEKEFAEALVNEGQNEEALLHFKKAYDYYFAEDQPQAAIQCKIRIARLHGEMDHFEEAIPLFEEIGQQYATGALRHQAKDFFICATLCRCALITEDNRTESSVRCCWRP